ncbi:hypothetical protein ACFO4P_17070 [Epilithonimonas pallida]|uniref:Uncharacterized protein n=1 Tax=Epilithonimonas pallida TaxID=373671 RepID=A0ABY1R4U8_9FLAO|nr:hypothetical protein [Epilithonimonas pallida]SMP94700.1 hypothetical protein SAMN05421679_10699 [Epilithonimonas pallida]
MSPFELREFLAELKSETNGINKTISAVNDSVLAKKVGSISPEQNMILVGVLPSYGSNGQNVDNVRTVPITQLMVLEKCDYSGMTEDQEWEMFQRTFLAITEIKETIVQKVSEDCPNYLINIDVNSLNIDPVWGKAECCGWSMDIEFE